MLFVKKIKVYLQGLKYRRQRAKRGWSEKDTLDIDHWFLDVVPQMLEYLKEHHMGFPSDLQKEYINIHSGELNMTYDEYCSWHTDENSEGYMLREKVDEACNRLWNEILGRMIFLLREACEEPALSKILMRRKAEEFTWNFPKNTEF